MSRIRHRRPILAVLSAAFVLSVSAVQADRSRDHERARLAVERGEALPLADILQQVRPALGGEVVGVSFERKRDRWIYEFKVIRTSGGLVEFYVDAATAQIIKQEEER